MTQPPEFDAAFRAKLEDLFRWRRDVRHFKRDPVAPDVLDALLDQAFLAPSVGYSQPWRFVSVEDASLRAAVRENFLHCNKDALADYAGERAKLYASLKLSGLDDAPVHLAVFSDQESETGHGLGQKTMPESRAFAAVMAIYTLWLAARAQGIGMGWVSILDPERIKELLRVPDAWQFVAYLCVGYPKEIAEEPELKRRGWEDTDPAAHKLLKR